MKKIFFSEVCDGITNGFYLELYNNKEAVLTGDAEIIELEDTVLKIKNRENIISISGENLKIINYSSTGLRIGGTISFIEFK